MSAALQRPLDHSELRFNQLSIIVLVVLAFVLNSTWLVAFVGLVMAVGTIWPKAGLFKRFYHAVIKPRECLEPEPFRRAGLVQHLSRLGASRWGKEDGAQPEEVGERAPPSVAAEGVKCAASQPMKPAPEGNENRAAGGERSGVVGEARIGLHRVGRAERAPDLVLYVRKPLTPNE